MAGHRALGRAGDGRFLTEGDAGADRVPRTRRDGRDRRRSGPRPGRSSLATRAAASRYPTVADAERAGYRRIDRFHWVNASMLDDGRVADPDAIESLIYADADGTPTLTGAMYIADGTAHGPQLGGPLTAWHFHRYEPRLCTVARSFPVGRSRPTGTCVRGSPADRSPEMLHVWFDDRDDPFSERMIGIDHAHGADRDADGLGAVTTIAAPVTRPVPRFVGPSIRDARLHTAAVLITIQVLGQTVLDFELSIAQILVSIGTCALLEVGDHLPPRRARSSGRRARC